MLETVGPRATPPTRSNDAVATVPVALGNRSYDIHIADGLVHAAAERIVELTAATHVIVFYDGALQTTADGLCGQFEKLSPSGSSTSVRFDRLAIPPGEPSKSMGQFDRSLQFCLDRRGDRRSVIVALGGGVVGDLAGFVAASYARGVRFVQIPTTLLSMVDSSVGGKTGINLPGGKNMVGAFWQPQLVLIDPSLLATLPDRDYVSGIAEIIKYGVIADPEFFDWLSSNMDDLRHRKTDAVVHAVSRSCQTKADVVRRDERETGDVRATLNYGHTFAHAIEATTGYGTVTHGEAVAIGMEMAMALAVQLSRIDSECQLRQRRLIEASGLPLSAASLDVAIDPNAMIQAMAKDKKVADGRLRFVLPTRIGHVELVGDVPPEQVRDAIEQVG